MLDDGLRVALDRLAADAVTAAQAPGVVAAIASADDIHVAAAGDATIDTTPMRRDAIFRIASITKPMTAVAALTLVAEGAITLDDPVDRWLPELADRRVLTQPGGPLTDTIAAQRAITLRDLLTNTMGFGMDGAMFTAAEPWPAVVATHEWHLHTIGPPTPGDTPDPDTWIARLGELPLLAQPGAKWLYQTASAVLGVLVARVAGEPLGDVLRARVFEPLGMHDTGFWTSDTRRLATAYGSRGVDGVVDTPDGEWSRPPAFPDGGGGLVSTVDDVVAFGRMLLRGGDPVLDPDSVREMTRDQLTDAQKANDWGAFTLLGDRGWGWGLSTFADGAYGWEGGSGTSWRNLPAPDRVVVTLTQREWDETGPPAICEDVVTLARGD